MNTFDFLKMSLFNYFFRAVVRNAISGLKDISAFSFKCV